MPTLDNDTVRLTIDERGRLHELIHHPTGHNYAGGGEVWRLYYRLGQCFQQEMLAGHNVARIDAHGDRLTLTYNTLHGPDGELPIGLALTVALDGELARWSATVRNGSRDVVVKEIHAPLLARARVPHDHELITTAYGGCREGHPAAFVRHAYPPSTNWYCNDDHRGLQVQRMYPGVDAACNCFTFAGASQGLYFGSHDASFANTIHLWRLEGPEWTELEAGFAKHLLLEPGDSTTIDGYVLSPYTGDWHAAADIYADWTRTWYRPSPKPDWLTGGEFRGWHRLILKHQNGEVLFPYDSFDRIYNDGQAAGVDGLFMFGWWPGGFDRMYPEYVPADDLGGEQALRDNIRHFQVERGGHVILYASGRLVDRNSDFYKQHGAALSIKKASGDEAGDSYLFSNPATYERCYGAAELVPMCLDCRTWIDKLKHVIDLAVDYGCHGVFFDQLGLQEYPCCDPTHGHPVPYVTQAQGKRRVIGELRDYARSRDPQLAFGVEVFADAVGEYFDFVHGLYHQRYIATNPDYRERGEKPQYTAFVDWARYIFPGLIISDRDIRDETDFERRVNIALLRGLVHDIEIHRCRRTIAHTPNYQRYLGQINALRARHGPLLAPASYRDTRGFTLESDDVDARAFEHAGRRAVLLTQSHLEHAAAGLHVDGARYVQADGAGAWRISDDGSRVELGRHAVAMVIFERETRNGS